MQAHGKYLWLSEQIQFHSEKYHFDLNTETNLFVFKLFLFLVRQSKDFSMNHLLFYRVEWQRTEPVPRLGWAARCESDALIAVVDDAPAAKPAERGRIATRSASICAEQFKLWPWLLASGPNACVESELGK